MKLKELLAGIDVLEAGADRIGASALAALALGR